MVTLLRPAAPLLLDRGPLEGKDFARQAAPHVELHRLGRVDAALWTHRRAAERQRRVECGCGRPFKGCVVVDLRHVC